MHKDRHDAPPRLVPTGNVDEVLLTGKSRGRDLTLFQSVGLAVFGVCLVLGIGIPMIVSESLLQSEFERMGLSYPKNFNSIVIGALMCILGAAWIVMGSIGVVKIRRRSRSKDKPDQAISLKFPAKRKRSCDLSPIDEQHVVSELPTDLNNLTSLYGAAQALFPARRFQCQSLPQNLHCLALFVRRGLPHEGHGVSSCMCVGT